MKYILVFLAFWPGNKSEGVVVEPYNSYVECRLAAQRMWEIVKADGARDYEAICEILEISEV